MSKQNLKYSLILALTGLLMISGWAQDAAPATTPATPATATPPPDATPSTAGTPTTTPPAPADTTSTASGTPAVSSDTTTNPPAATTPAATATPPAPAATTDNPQTPPSTPAADGTTAPVAPGTETTPPIVRKALPPVKIVITEPSPPLPPEFLLPPPGGPVEEFVGHRKTDRDGSGWGWIKKGDDTWKKARWVTLRENAKSPAPWRALGNKLADDNFEYKMFGYFANHQVYDPIYDEMLDVFVIDHYEVIGPATPLTRQPGPDERFTASRTHDARTGSKSNRQVQSETDAQQF